MLKIVLLTVEELKMKEDKKIKVKLTKPSAKPQEDMKKKQECEEHFPSRDKLARMEKPPGRVKTDVIAPWRAEEPRSLVEVVLCPEN